MTQQIHFLCHINVPLSHLTSFVRVIFVELEYNMWMSVMFDEDSQKLPNLLYELIRFRTIRQHWF